MASYYVLLAERRRSNPAPKEEEKVNEEQWPLREVVFVEDVKNVPVGKVLGSSTLSYCRFKIVNAVVYVISNVTFNSLYNIFALAVVCLFLCHDTSV